MKEDFLQRIAATRLHLQPNCDLEAQVADYCLPHPCFTMHFVHWAHEPPGGRATQLAGIPRERVTQAIANAVLIPLLQNQNLI